MSVTRSHDRIVVGVDSSRASRTAVLWAAHEARLRRCDLVVTHVETRESGPPEDELSWTALLARSAAAASSREPGVAVGTLLLRGAISDQLLELSRSAALLVVGVDRDRPRSAHGMIGPIEDRVVAQAQCPVVTVSNSDWAAEPERGRIVVAWTQDVPGQRAMAVAAAEAHLRGSSLTIVAIEPDPNNESRLAEALAELTRQWPSLQVTAHSAHPDALWFLVQRAAEADLLVVGSTHSADRWSIRTGALSGALMRQSLGPVMLVGHLARQRSASLIASTAAAPA